MTTPLTDPRCFFPSHPEPHFSIILQNLHLIALLSMLQYMRAQTFLRGGPSTTEQVQHIIHFQNLPDTSLTTLKKSKAHSHLTPPTPHTPRLGGKAHGPATNTHLFAGHCHLMLLLPSSMPLSSKTISFHHGIVTPIPKKKGSQLSNLSNFRQG